MLWRIIAFTVTPVVLLLNIRRLRWVWIIIKNLPRDIRSSITMIKIHWLSKKLIDEKITLFKQFDSVVKLHPQKVAIYFEDQVWTYADMAAFSNKITKYFLPQNFGHGDSVALLLDNRPEYHCIILGLSRLGLVTALINTNLQQDSLLHSIRVSKPKAIIFGSNYWEAINCIIESIKDIKLFHIEETLLQNTCNLPTSISLNKELQNIADNLVEKQLTYVSHEDPVVYIYTSGTTGLPKASIMTHSRFAIMAMGMQILSNLKKDDIIYTCLPFYHAGGAIAAGGQTILCGTTTVVRRKFSASNYFKDCTTYKVTAAQYIGEMCRYILSAYAEKEPEKHQVRVMFGNGLNPLVWKMFVSKFGIKDVVEVYGSTEGVAALINTDNKIGSVGYVPWFFQALNWVVLVKCDSNGKPVRDKSGRCIKCNTNEAGVIIGKVKPNHAVFNFKGYTDKSATQQKILYDVFSKGDVYFNSGDILIYDEYGYFYFKDRLGDTFRWKGENVSTTEVETMISKLINFHEVLVYGVQIPNTEGRAGMAAIVDTAKSINIESLANDLKSSLPNYAIPLFIRILNAAPLTSTYKLKKVELREEGYNANIITDDLYFLHPIKKSYTILNKELYDDIVTNRLNL